MDTVETEHPVSFARPILSAPQQIAAMIRVSILDGTMPAGTRLPPENELAEIFGVSRPTLREALRELRAEDMLVVTRGRSGGYRVGEFSPVTLGAKRSKYVSLTLGENLTHEQVFEVRWALEVLASQEAALNRTETDLDQLEQASDIPTDASFDDLLRCDVCFHRALADATHNPLIIAYVGASSIALMRTRNLEASHSERVVGNLDAVLDAVRERQPRRAGDAMRKHLQYFADFYANYTG